MNTIENIKSQLKGIEASLANHKNSVEYKQRQPQTLHACTMLNQKREALNLELDNLINGVEYNVTADQVCIHTGNVTKRVKTFKATTKEMAIAMMVDIYWGHGTTLQNIEVK